MNFEKWKEEVYEQKEGSETSFDISSKGIQVKRTRIGRKPIAPTAIYSTVMMLAIIMVVIARLRMGSSDPTIFQPPSGGGGSYTASPDSLYNSNEPGCDGTDPTILMCEDFERKNNGTFPGSWYEFSCDSANALPGGQDAHTKGWCGGHGFEPHPIIHGGAVDCSDTLVVGFGTCTAHLGQFPLSLSGCNIPCADSGAVANDEGDITTAMHHFRNGVEYQEIFVREYFWYSPGFVFSSTKWPFTFNRCCNTGGIQWGAVGVNSAFNDTSSLQSNLRLFNYMCELAPANCGGVGGQYVEQNVNLPRDSLKNYRGHWGSIQVRIKLNTPGVGNTDGGFEMWLDDCGPTLPGTCTGTPTKVLSFLNLPMGKIAGTGGTNGMGGIGEVWFEHWSNPQVGGHSAGPSPYGTLRYDNLVVATRFIEFYVPN